MRADRSVLVRAAVASAVAVATAVAFGVALSPVGAAAAGSLRVNADPIKADGLAPGHHSTHVLRVGNDSEAAMRVDLRAAGVEGAENRCLSPEVRTPGEECDADGGELGRDLLVTLQHAGTTVWAGAFEDLRSGVTLAEDLAAGEEWVVEVGLHLAEESPNDTMTDSLTFTTVVEASGAGLSEPETAGVQVELSGEDAGIPTEVDAGARVAVPLVGGSVSLWPLLLDGGAVVAAGVICGWWLRLRRRSSRVEAAAR